MRSTFAGLNTMVRGLMTSQTQLNTVGHNIANASTDGYSRQGVNAVATPSQTLYGSYGQNQIGTGVDAQSITRARDVFADRQYWQENSSTKYYGAQQTNYDKIETIFGETDKSGLQTSLSNFAGIWDTLSGSKASDYPTRVQVLGYGKDLATKITDDVSKLQDLNADNNSSIELKVESVNQLTSSIYDLNKKIVQAEATGGMANDLRDSRDFLVDKLSALVNVDVTEKENGSFSITSSGNTLVDGDGYMELATQTSTNDNYGMQDVKIVIKKTGTDFNPTSGELKGLQDSNAQNKEYIDQLGTMTAYLLTTFNDQHKAGYGIDASKTTGMNFFGVDGKDYSSLAYNQASGTWQLNGADINLQDVFSEFTVNSVFYKTKSDGTLNTDVIAARSAEENIAGGSNATLLKNLINSTASSKLNNTTLGSYYIGILGKLGVDAAAVDRKMTTQDTIMTQVGNWRDETAGVNTNEELTNMIKFQQGYSAASRCLTTMDEMLDKLINSTGTVGR
jgi:flagellar hook-associated protein 1 FlgK